MVYYVYLHAFRAVYKFAGKLTCKILCKAVDEKNENVEASNLWSVGRENDALAGRLRNRVRDAALVCRKEVK